MINASRRKGKHALRVDLYSVKNTTVADKLVTAG
jgi:hypothetical protein